MKKNSLRLMMLASVISGTAHLPLVYAQVCPPGSHMQCHITGGGHLVGCHCVPDNPHPPLGGHAQLFPSYYLITILYSVPGELSEANYADGSSTGSKTENAKSFKSGLTMEVETNVFDVKAGYAATSKDGTSIEVKKDQSHTLSVNGTSTELKHDDDVFYLWTNAEIDINQTGPSAYKQTVKTRGTDSMNIVPVTVAELRNPSLLPSWKKSQLGKLTDSDRAAILSQDPFTQDGGNILTNPRFIKIDTLQLDGPDSPGDPVTGQGLELNSEVTRAMTKANEQSAEVSVELGGDVSFGFVSKVMVGTDLEWTWETTTENADGTLQKTEVILKTAVPRFNGVFDVYEDTLFNSLVFVLVDTPLPTQAALIGTVHAADNKPIANQLVTVTLPDGKQRRVFTNANGIYRVFTTAEGMAQVRVGNQTSSASIARARQAKLDIQIQ